METRVLSRLGAGHASRCSNLASPFLAFLAFAHLGLNFIGFRGVWRWIGVGSEGLGDTHVRCRD